MKQYPWLKRLALALVGGVTLFGIICGFCTLFHLTLNWQEELLLCTAPSAPPPPALCGRLRRLPGCV